MIADLEELVQRLKKSPNVIGIARYGGRRVDDMSPGGDFDLFVIVKTRPDDVESIHFYVGEIPVDLSIRTLADLRRTEPLSHIDHVLVNAEILSDDTGTLPQEIDSLRERWKQPPSRDLTEDGIAWDRFCHQHAIEKARGRLDEDPLLCEFLLATSVYWLIQAYFRVRRLKYPGERGALEYLKENDPEIHRCIRDFYTARDLKQRFSMIERLTGLVLAPVGGPWRRDELLVLGVDEPTSNLKSEGERLFADLFGTTAHDAFRKE